MAVFTSVTKPRLSWAAPAVAPSTDKHLLIGSGFKLLIGGGYRLIINSARNATNWTEITKSR